MQRFNLYLNKNQKSLVEIINENYVEFKQWYLERNNSSLIEFNESYGNEELIAFLNKNEITNNYFETWNNRVLGEICSEFIWEYCSNIGNDKINVIECIGPDLGIWRFTSSRQLIDNLSNSEFLMLWDYLFYCGRSLHKTLNFERLSDDSLKIGYLTHDEVIRLQYFINHYFGDLQIIRNRFWTSNDFDIFNNNFQVSKHSPISEGLEIATLYLDKAISFKTHIFSTIE